MFALYRKGNTHEVNGIKCEIVRVTLGELDHYQADGWTDDINELDPNYVTEVDLQKIVGALKEFDPENKDQFTDKGYPKIEAVRKFLGDESIEKKDLNAAWKLLNPQE